MGRNAVFSSSPLGNLAVERNKRTGRRKGVSKIGSKYQARAWDKSKGKWRARAYYNGKNYSCGHFDDEAALADRSKSEARAARPSSR